MAEDPNTLALFLRLALSLGVVLGLVGGITWVLRRRGLLSPTAGAAASGRLEVLDRKSLGKNASLVLARVGDTAVLLGVSGDRIEVVSDRPGLDAAWRELEAEVEAPAAAQVGTEDQAPVDVLTHAHPQARTRAAHHRTGASTRTGGARRTGLPMAAPAAGRTRMSFIEALQELTVRRS